MSEAIAKLEMHAEMCENNVPIHNDAGNTRQALLSASMAASCRNAIAVLKADQKR